MRKRALKRRPFADQLMLSKTFASGWLAKKNPHAELCAWANGLRPDSPQYDEPQKDDLEQEFDDRERDEFEALSADE